MVFLQAGTLFMHHRPGYGNCAAHQTAFVERADAIARDMDSGRVACACRHFRANYVETHTIVFLAKRAMAGTAVLASAPAPAATSAQHDRAQRRKVGAAAPCFWHPGIGCEPSCLMRKLPGGSHEHCGQGRGVCPARGGVSSEAEGAVAVTRMESLQRSRMGSGQASVAGSMLLRAAAMAPGAVPQRRVLPGNGRGPLQDSAPEGHCKVPGVP